MLQLTLFLQDESFDEESGKFLPPTDEYVLCLEHSLVSASKWESKWEVPFLSSDKTIEQTLDYIRFMIVGGEIPPEVFARITPDDIDSINEYINSKQTATWFNDAGKKPDTPREIITAELIYYWMIAHNIPIECQNWHLSRLLTLIKVCNVKNAPKDKVSAREAARSRRELNEQRKREFNTKG